MEYLSTNQFSVTIGDRFGMISRAAQTQTMEHNSSNKTIASVERILVAIGLKIAAVMLIVNLVALAAYIYFQTVSWYSSDNMSEAVTSLISTLWLVIPISAAWALHQTMRYERRLLATIVISFACWVMTFVWSFFAVMASWNPERDAGMQYAVSLICETYCPGDTWEQYVQRQR